MFSGPEFIGSSGLELIGAELGLRRFERELVEPTCVRGSGFRVQGSGSGGLED